MGKQDTQMKQYLGNNRRFANLINTSVFKGKQKIDATSLEERDTTGLSVIVEGDKALPNTEKHIIKQRKKDITLFKNIPPF